MSCGCGGASKSIETATPEQVASNTQWKSVSAGVPPEQQVVTNGKPSYPSK